MRDALASHFLKRPECILFRWNLTTYALLLKGEEEGMEGCIHDCIDAVRIRCETLAPSCGWYIAVSSPTLRLSTLNLCFSEVSRLWAYRHIAPGHHILTADTVASLTGTGSNGSLSALDAEKVSPALLTGMLRRAGAEEVDSFVSGYIHSVSDALAFAPFCQYLMLSVRFTAAEFIVSLGLEQGELFDGLT